MKATIKADNPMVSDLPNKVVWLNTLNMLGNHAGLVSQHVQLSAGKLPVQFHSIVR